MLVDMWLNFIDLFGPRRTTIEERRHARQRENWQTHVAVWTPEHAMSVRNRRELGRAATIEAVVPTFDFGEVEFA